MAMLWLWIFAIVMEIALIVLLVRLVMRLKKAWHWATVQRHGDLTHVQQFRQSARQLRTTMDRLNDDFGHLGGFGGWKAKVASMVFSKLFGR